MSGNDSFKVPILDVSTWQRVEGGHRLTVVYAGCLARGHRGQAEQLPGAVAFHAVDRARYVRAEVCGLRHHRQAKIVRRVRVDADAVPARYRGIGVRVEDDVHVTGAGPENLTLDAPKSVAEIQREMRAEEAPAEGDRELTYVAAYNECMRQVMSEDDRVFVAGEDVGRYGGVFGHYARLFDEFGPDRCIDTPIAEHVQEWER